MSVELGECCDILIGCPPKNHPQLSKCLSGSSCALLTKGEVTGIPRISRCVFAQDFLPVNHPEQVWINPNGCFYPVKFILPQQMLHQEEQLPFSLEKPQFSSLKAFCLLDEGLFRVLGLTRSSVCK